MCCFQAGSPADVPPVRQPFQSAGGGRVFVQQCRGVSAAAPLSGGHARRPVRVLLHHQWVFRNHILLPDALLSNYFDENCFVESNYSMFLNADWMLCRQKALKSHRWFAPTQLLSFNPAPKDTSSGNQVESYQALGCKTSIDPLSQSGSLKIVPF